MASEAATLSIISLASGVAIGYLVGMIKYLADHGWRLDSLDII